MWLCVIKSCSPRNSTPHIITSDGGTIFDVHVDGTGCVSKKYWRDFKCLKQWYTFHCIVYSFSCLLSVCVLLHMTLWQWWHVDMDPVPVLGPTLCHDLGQVELLHTALLLHGIWIGTPCTLHCTDSKNQQPYNKAPDYLQNVWDIIWLVVRFGLWQISQWKNLYPYDSQHIIKRIPRLDFRNGSIWS